MNLNKQKGRMFKSVDYTGSFFYGCNHGCAYPCYARLMSGWRGRSFEPRLVQKDLTQILKVKDVVIFLNSFSDPCCPGISDENLEKMLDWIAIQDPSNTFLIQTKNPGRLGRHPFFGKLLAIKDRVRIGTTIESTDRTHKYSQAPGYLHRAGYLSNFKRYGFETFLSGEPLLKKLNPKEYFGWVDAINPTVTEFGLLNYRKHSKIQLFKNPNRVDPDPVNYETLRNSMLDANYDFIEKDSLLKWRETEAYNSRIGETI